MPRKPAPDGPTWNFYVDWSSSGLPYVKASYNRWNSSVKKPRIAEKVHVGRLHDDGSVTPGKTFLARFPEFAGRDIYYFENRLLDHEAYLNATAEAAADQEAEAAQATPCDEPLETNFTAASLEAGRPMAAWNVMTASGMLDDLKEEFGDEDGQRLAAFAAYLFCEPAGALGNFTDWLGRVSLPDIEPLSGRPGEVLSRVTGKRTQCFFRRRLKALHASGKKNPRPFAVALDCTSFRNDSWEGEGLRQSSLLLICDRHTGEAIYAHQCSAPAGDRTGVARVLQSLVEAGLSPGEVELVSERPCRSSDPVRYLQKAGLKFVIPAPLKEKELQEAFEEFLTELQRVDNWMTEIVASAITVREADPSDEFPEELRTHLYWMDEKALERKRMLLRAVDDLIRARNDGDVVREESWERYGDCISDSGPGAHPRWVRNPQAVDARLRSSGGFALWSNVSASAVEALLLYRERNEVEALWRIFDADLGAERLTDEETGCTGRVFVFVLAMSVRAMLARTLRRNCAAKRIPLMAGMLDTVLATLATVAAQSRGTPRQQHDAPTRKQRLALELFGLLPLTQD